MLADTYNQFAYFIQNRSYTMKLFINGQKIAEDNDGNIYYFCSIYEDAMHGRCFHKVIDIRKLSMDALSRFRNYAEAEIEIGGIVFSHGKRNSKSK